MKVTVRTTCFSLLAIFVAGSAGAQIPDTFTNLKVLPEKIGKPELMQVMRNFASSLGVRCIHCHVGENPNTLKDFDFADDSKAPKRIARVMMEMVRNANTTYLPQLGRQETFEVGCFTCHHGMTRPEKIEDLVLRTYQGEGIDAAVTKYRDIRGKFFGRGAYDFGQGPLNDVTETLTKRKEFDAALTAIELNLEYHGEEPYPHFLRAQVLLSMGRVEDGVEVLEHVVAMDPDNNWYRGRLEQARKRLAESNDE